MTKAMQSNHSAGEVEKSTQRRRFPRYIIPDKPRAGFIGAGLRVAGKVREIGLEGLFLSTKEPIAVGKPGKVGVEFPNRFFRANAVVRYVLPGRGFGVEFITMSTLDREAIRSFCGGLKRAGSMQTE